MKKLLWFVISFLLVWISFWWNFFVPMTVFWNINYETGIDISSSMELKIYNSNNIFIKKLILTNKSKYWTNSAFDSENKVLLKPFDGNLKFTMKIWDNLYDNIQIIANTWYNCSTNFTFQQWKLCKYDLVVKNTHKAIQNLQTPTNFKVVSITDSSVELSWDKINGVEKYNITYSNKSRSVDTNNILLTWLASNASYIINLQAVNGDKTSDEVSLNMKTLNVLNIDNLSQVAVRSDNFKTSLLNNNVIEVQKNNIKNVVPNNMINTKDVIVSTDGIEITKSLLNMDLVLVSEKDNKVNTGVSVVLPNNVQLSGDSNIKIFPPVILDKQKSSEVKNFKNEIKTKITLDSIVKVPTSKPVYFNGYVTICSNTLLSNTNNVKIYYSHNGSNWQLDDNVKNINVGNWKLCFQVNHFTTFAIGEEQSTNSWNSWWNSWSSSSSWWGGGWSWTPPVKTPVKSKFVSLISVENTLKIKINEFRTAKFKKAISLVNSIIEKQLFTPAYFVVGKTLYNNLYASYVNFLDALKKFEASKSNKEEAKKILKQFLIYYVQTQNKLVKVIKTEKLNINWISIKLDKVIYKDDKLTKIINNILDKLIIKELNKPRYIFVDVDHFINIYNNFKLAVKYMEETNKVEWKKLAKQYAKQMLVIFKK